MGNPVHFILSDGQVYDSKIAIPLLSELTISKSNILDDRAYGTKEIRIYISEQGAEYTIPPKSNNPDPGFCYFWLYKERHLVECFFNKIKALRHVSTCYDNWRLLFLPLFILLHLLSIQTYT